MHGQPAEVRDPVAPVLEVETHHAGAAPRTALVDLDHEPA
jgi:hypothetical protein